MYYQLVTNTTQRSNAVSRISTYYSATISSNVANAHAFNYWVFQSMRSANNPDLGNDVNSALSLSINSTASVSSYRGIACPSVPTSILPGGSVISLPTALSTTTTPTKSKK
jgi:hypothetical protein